MISVWIVHVDRHARTARSGPPIWAAVLLVALVENLIGVLSVSTAISLAEGTPQYRRIPEMLKIGIVVSLTNASIALMGLTVLWANPESIWLFVLPTVTAALAYRAYISERQQHESIELLYESTRILQRSPQLDTALVCLLDHARKMFRADVAEIRLLPRHEGDDILRCQVGPGDRIEVMQPVGPTLDDPLLIRAVTERQGRLVDLAADEESETPRAGRRVRKALVAPLLGESTLVGTLFVSDPLNDLSTFEAEDLKLFETLANHTAIALENGQLEQSLEQLGRLKEELHHQALHDPLTGLANRSLFTQVVASRLESPDPERHACRSSCSSTSTTSSWSTTASGTPPATRCWSRSATGSSRSCARRDMAARLGGDEFAVLLRDTPDMKASMRVANRLTAAMGPLFEIEGRDVNVRASVGVAAGRPGVDTAGDLLRNADVAMYSAKARGKGRVVVFEPSMHDAVMVRAQLSADLEHAIAAREFVLQYQPIVEIDQRPDGRRRGARPLGASRARPDRSGRLHPRRRGVRLDPRDRPLGAQPGLPAGPRVAGPGRRHAVHRQRQHLGPPARPARLRRRGAEAIIREAGVAPTQIVLEMTETSMLQDSAATRDEAAGPA